MTLMCLTASSTIRKNQVSRSLGRVEITEDEIEELESAIDNALNHWFFRLHGLSLCSDSTYEDDMGVQIHSSGGLSVKRALC